MRMRQRDVSATNGVAFLRCCFAGIDLAGIVTGCSGGGKVMQVGMFGSIGNTVWLRSAG